MGAPKVQTVQPRSQASGFSEDFIRMMMGTLTEDAFGLGVSPLQREAGTAFRQFMNSGGGNINFNAVDVPAADFTSMIRDITGPSFDPKFDLGKQMGAIETASRRRTNEQAADLREGMGIAGTRFGSALGNAEAKLRSDNEANLAVTMGDLAAKADQMDQARAAMGLQAQGMQVNRDQALVDMLMRDLFGRADIAFRNEAGRTGAQQQTFQNMAGGWNQLAAMGMQNLQPLMMLAQLGIIPQEVMATPNPWMQLGLGLIQAGGTAAGAAAGSTLKIKKDVERVTEEEEDAMLRRLEKANLYHYRYKGMPEYRLGLVIEDETTPNELVKDETVLLYDMISMLLAAVKALSRRVVPATA